jgi:prevent-host-death family protein
MQPIGVAKLKANLSRYLNHVKHGGEIVITERGLPVAKIVPLPATESHDSRRERLARAGLLQLGSGKARYRRFKVPKGSVDIGAGVLGALLADREEGR